MVRFTRVSADRDLVEVRRADGSVVSWDFPTHVSRLPHDLCHLVVEDGLRIGLGFWGLVSRGVDVRVVDNHAELALDGSPLRELPGIDFSELLHAEEAVAVLSPSGLKTEPIGAMVVVTLTSGASPPILTQNDIDRIAALCPATTPGLVQSVRSRLVALDQEWAAMAIGSSIALTFPSDNRTSELLDRHPLSSARPASVSRPIP